jgi:predicted nucleic acid-binding Zn ribbon protein
VIRADRLVPAVLADVIRKAPLCPEKVDFVWRSIVGPTLARATKIRLDEHGVLHVMAADEQWAREVKRSSKLILARLATLLGPGVAKRIHVREEQQGLAARRPR